MKKPESFPNDCIYALRLHMPDGHSLAGNTPALRGQLEHVMSGRRHEFNAGEQLLACLSLELSRVALTSPLPQSD